MNRGKHLPRQILQLIGGFFIFLFPLLFSEQLFWVHVLTLIFIYIILSVSLRLVAITGLLNLASVAFMGIGAYASAVISTRLEVPFWVAMPIAGGICALFSLALGIPLLRLIGAYFFIGTVTIAMIVRVFFGNFFVDIFQGIPGFSPIAKPYITIPGILEVVFISKVSQYYLALGVMAISLLIMYGLENSKYGRAWKAIAQADNLAESVGVDLFKNKLLAFATCNFFCGIAGATYGAIMNIITPHEFDLPRMFIIVMYCVVGGMHSFWGAIIGTVFMAVIAEFLRTLGQWELFGYGVILVLAMRFMPQGLAGLMKPLLFPTEASK
jgi:branched-chain amino acid transport system permease protein